MHQGAPESKKNRSLVAIPPTDFAAFQFSIELKFKFEPLLTHVISTAASSPTPGSAGGVAFEDPFLPSFIAQSPRSSVVNCVTPSVDSLPLPPAPPTLSAYKSPASAGGATRLQHRNSGVVDTDNSFNFSSKAQEKDEEMQGYSGPAASERNLLLSFKSETQISSFDVASFRSSFNTGHSRTSHRRPAGLSSRGFSSFSLSELQGKRMDTFQICKLLLRWIQERSPFLTSALRFYKREGHVNLSLQPLALEAKLDPSRQVKAEKQGRAEVSTASNMAQDLDQLVILEQRVESLLETRNLLAHRPLSLSTVECQVAINAARSLSRSFSPTFLEKDSDLLAAESSIKMFRESATFRLFVALRLLFILEKTVVLYIRKLQEEDKLPSNDEVQCVATLCVFLKKEQRHDIIFRATGNNPRPLTLKRKIDPLWFPSFPKSKEEESNHSDAVAPESQESTSKQKSTLKSHLDLVIEARQAFNHGDMMSIMDSQVKKWIQSTIALLRFANGRFDRAVAKVEALAEYYERSSSVPPSLSGTMSEGVSDLSQTNNTGGSNDFEVLRGPSTPAMVIEVYPDQEEEAELNSPRVTDEENVGESIPRVGVSRTKIRLMKSTPYLVYGRDKVIQSILESVILFLDFDRLEGTQSPNTAGIPSTFSKAEAESSQRQESRQEGRVERAIAKPDDAMDRVKANDSRSEGCRESSFARRIVVLSGHSGMGKSTVAVKAAKEIEARDMFECHFWVPAASVEVLSAGLLDLISLRAGGLAAVGDFQMKIQDIIKKVAQVAITDRCLIVFDDVTHQTFGHVKSFLDCLADVNTDRKSGTFIIVTTKCVFAEEELPNEWIVPIPPLEPEDSFALLKSIVSGENLLRKQSTLSMQLRRKLVEEICSSKSFLSLLDKHIGNSPLGLSILAQLLLTTKSVDAVIAHFETDYERVGLVREDDVNVYGGKHFGLEVSLYQLLKTTNLNRPMALQILYACSILSPAGIPLLLLNPLPTALLAEDEQMDRAKERRYSLDKNTQMESDEEREERQQKDRMEVRAILDELYSYGIIEIVRDRNSLVVVPQLTQRALRYILVQHFGISPGTVRRAIARGVLHLAVEDPLQEIDISLFANREEAVLWLECMLSSKFSEHIIAEAIGDGRKASLNQEDVANIPEAGPEEDKGAEHCRETRSSNGYYDNLCVRALLLAINLSRVFQPTEVPQKLAALMPSSLPSIIDDCLTSEKTAQALVQCCDELRIPLGYVLILCQHYTAFMNRQKSVPVIEVILKVAEVAATKESGHQDIKGAKEQKGILGQQSIPQATITRPVYEPKEGKIEVMAILKGEGRFSADPHLPDMSANVFLNAFRLRHAQILWETGKRDSAKVIWESVRAQTSSIRDPNAYVVATYYLAYVHYFNLEPNKAIQMLEKVLEELKSWNHRWQTKIDNFLMVLVFCKLDTGDAGGALEILHRSLSHLLDHCSPNNLRVGSRYGYIGDAYTMLGEYEAAERALMEFDRIMKKELGTDAYADRTYHFLIDLYIRQHRYEEALRLDREMSAAMIRVKRPFAYIAPIYLAEIEILLAIGNVEAVAEAKTLCKQFLLLHGESVSEGTKMNDSFWCMCALYMSRIHYQEALQEKEKEEGDSGDTSSFVESLLLALFRSVESLAALEKAYDPRMKRADRTRFSVYTQHARNLQEAIAVGYTTKTKLNEAASVNGLAISSFNRSNSIADSDEEQRSDSATLITKESANEEFQEMIDKIMGLPSTIVNTSDLGTKAICGLTFLRTTDEKIHDFGVSLLQDVASAHGHPNHWRDFALRTLSRVKSS